MLAKWLNESASTVVFSGAGMSTESDCRISGLRTEGCGTIGTRRH